MRTTHHGLGDAVVAPRCGRWAVQCRRLPRGAAGACGGTRSQLTSHSLHAVSSRNSNSRPWSAAPLLACSLAACPAVRQGPVADTRSLVTLFVAEDCVLSHLQLPPVVGDVTEVLLDESRGVLAIKGETSLRHGVHGCPVQDVLEK